MSDLGPEGNGLRARVRSARPSKSRGVQRPSRGDRSRASQTRTGSSGAVVRQTGGSFLILAQSAGVARTDQLDAPVKAALNAHVEFARSTRPRTHRRRHPARTCPGGAPTTICKCGERVARFVVVQRLVAREARGETDSEARARARRRDALNLLSHTHHHHRHHHAHRPRASSRRRSADRRFGRRPLGYTAAHPRARSRRRPPPLASRGARRRARERASRHAARKSLSPRAPRAT